MIRAIVFDWGRTLYDSETADFFPAVPDLLADLSGRYKLAIVSLVSGDYDTRLAARQSALREADLARFFSIVRFVPLDKEAAYEETLVAFDVRGDEVAIVDDRASRGIAWGNRRGATTIWLRRGRFADELPDRETGEPTHTITEIGDLAALLESGKDG